jgi:hypothetical protein
LGKPEGKSALGGRKHRWKNNIKINLKGIKWDIVN